MLTIKFSKKELELKFGLGELNELDKTLGLDIQDVNVGQGLTFLVPNLQEGNPIAIAKVVKACTRSHRKHPKTDEDIEEVLSEAHTQYGSFKGFGKAIIEEMGKHVMTRDLVEEKPKTDKAQDK